MSTPHRPLELLVTMAASISVSACECGNLYVRLHDRTGAIFAAASMDVSTADQFLDQATDEFNKAILHAENPPTGGEHVH